jgi:Mn2+/Fe2+ NRAMP family transporter
VKTVLQIALGVIAAIGGFMEIGDLVFSAQAGATFGYGTLWAIPVGVAGIIVFAEMSGRVAAISGKPTFVLVRSRYGDRLSMFTLVSSLVLTVLTLGAELAGVGFILDYFFDVSINFFVLVGIVVLGAAAWFLPFGALEREFGYVGLALLVYAVASVDMRPDWGSLGAGFVPDAESDLSYWYFVVGLIAAALMPYEIYFYASGAIEERWGRGDLLVNRLNSIIGFSLGGILSVAVLTAAAQVLLPRGITPDSIGTVALIAQVPLGEAGLLFAFLGILFAVGGATIDTAFSAAYNLAQHQGWKWGKRRGLPNEPRFTISLLVFFVIGFAVAQTNVDPVALTEYAVIFSMPVLPLTYLPVLLAGNDRELMGEHVNGRFARVAGWAYFGLICVVAAAAPALFVMTNGG